MANPPKRKGTAGETELRRKLDITGLVRTPPTSPVDLLLPGRYVLEVLATRPDRGEWLMTMSVSDFLVVWDELVANGALSFGLAIEVKRYARFAHHSIFEDTFSR